MPRPHHALGYALVLLLSGWLSGCSGSEPSSSPSSTEASAPSREPSSDPSPATPKPTGPGLQGMLLPDAALPGLNEQAGWRTVRTSTGEPEPPRWVCQRFSLVSNGAVNAVQRSFESTKGNATAAQVIARTVDQRSAKRLFAVLIANARECAEQLQSIDRTPRGAVQPLSMVRVPRGSQAAWGVVLSGPVRGQPDSAYIDAVAVVQVKATVSVMSMNSIGQDYDYEPGKSPPELAIPLVASALGAS